MFGKFIKELMNINESSVTSLSGLVLSILFSPISTIGNIVERTAQIREANEILINDQLSLEAMRDYFRYTQFMDKYEGSEDFASNAKKELRDNTYANAIIDSGEAYALNELRKCVIQIAANGEIIRSFEDYKGKRT